MNPAMALLVKNKVEILEMINPRIRIREISFLKKIDEGKGMKILINNIYTYIFIR